MPRPQKMQWSAVWQVLEFTCKVSLSIFLNANLKKSQPFVSSGSTPPVFLAATRGYHQVVEVKCFQTAFKKEKTSKMADLYPFQVFKRFFDTNFLIENKFNQTILHMVLKAGYNNKVWSKLFSSDIV